MGLALFFLLRSMNKQLRKVVREPRWREEARAARPEAAGQEPAGQEPAGQEPADQPGQDYSRNGTSQA
jgi:hypothetical protein